MGRKSNIALIFFLGFFLISCGSKKKAAEISLFEELQKSNGYLNGSELKKLEYDYALKLLDKYDLTGFDEEDTLARFVRSGSYIWIASCYIGEDSNPFFCLKQTKEKQFKLVKSETVSAALGECDYDLEKMLVRAGEYVIISNKSHGSGYCGDYPRVFTIEGKEISRDEKFHFMSWNCLEELNDAAFCYERTFSYSLKDAILSVHVKEKKLDEETRQQVDYQEYDMRYALQHDRLVLKDTLRN
ncbi:hypothetical protein [Fluviicola sp.]|uniref:hypothetical protein n=1 Tax=Fluviicola sp. TaxID=1917219 RepID=UPI0026127F8D|nr:hypothetical protein [Fluviicola sp.]